MTQSFLEYLIKLTRARRPEWHIVSKDVVLVSIIICNCIESFVSRLLPFRRIIKFDVVNLGMTDD